MGWKGRPGRYRAPALFESAPPPPALPPGVHRLRVWAIAHPRVVAGLLYGLVALAAAVAAYLAIFTLFSPYDDEGTLLVTLKAFSHGEVLYRDVYSPYGPFYYELFGGFFALTGLSVSTDASRLIVIVVWVLTSGLFGLACQRLSGRLLLGVAGMIVAFGVLFVLVGEPMHPHGLGILLLGTFTLLAVSGPSRRVGLAGAIGGALLAALVMTKLNLGVFAVAALVFAAVLTVAPLYRRRWLRWPVLAAFLALPLAVVARDLGSGWAQSLAGLEILAILAVAIAAWPLRPAAGEDDEGMGEWLIAAACGFVASFAAILIAILLTGPSLSDVYRGMVHDAMRVRDTNLNPFVSPSAAVDWGIAAVAAATLISWLRPGAGATPSVWPGLLRVGAGLGIWFTITQSAPLSLNPAAGNPDSLALALAWVAAVPPAGPREGPFKRFLRVLLPAMAVAEVLQVYPVAGSQMRIAALTFVPVGALCIADGLAALRAWSAARGPLALQRFGVVAGVAIVALTAKLAIDQLARPIASNAVVYRDQRSLPFPEAGLLHLPAEQAAEYEGLVALLHEHRCTTFIGYPNVDSLYLWSGIDPPRPWAPGAWITALEASAEPPIVARLRASPRPCAIRSEGLAALWLNGRPRPETPLVRYIFNRFEPAAQAGGSEFLLPKRPAR
jgi:hypothetical protein